MGPAHDTSPVAFFKRSQHSTPLWERDRSPRADFSVAATDRQDYRKPAGAAGDRSARIICRGGQDHASFGCEQALGNVRCVAVRPALGWEPGLTLQIRWSRAENRLTLEPVNGSRRPADSSCGRAARCLSAEHGLCARSER